MLWLTSQPRIASAFRTATHGGPGRHSQDVVSLSSLVAHETLIGRSRLQEARRVAGSVLLKGLRLWRALPAIGRALVHGIHKEDTTAITSRAMVLRCRADAIVPAYRSRDLRFAP